jgi:hypothetical protein
MDVLFFLSLMLQFFPYLTLLADGTKLFISYFNSRVEEIVCPLYPCVALTYHNLCRFSVIDLAAGSHFEQNYPIDPMYTT